MILRAKLPLTFKATNTGRDLLCQPDTMQSIDQCYKQDTIRRATLGKLLTPLPLGAILFNVLYKTKSQFVCFNKTIFTLNMLIKAEFLYQLMYLRFICYKLWHYHITRLS